MEVGGGAEVEGGGVEVDGEGIITGEAAGT